MSVSSIGTTTAQQLLQINNNAAKPPTANTKSTDADGDHDGDTAAKDAKGLDVKG